MFSAEFTTAQKYNLKSQEHISTISLMPYQYTSLYDQQYLPKLSDKAYDVLSSYCRYRFLHTTQPLYDDAKNVKIEHKDGEILSYEIVNPFKYVNVSTDIRNWKHFTSSIQCEEADDCKDEIDRMTDITDEGVTFITSVEYDENCDFKCINVYDSSYNLVGYDNNHFLHLMNDYCKNSDRQPAGVIGFSNKTSDIKFKIMLDYDHIKSVYDGGSRLPMRVERPSISLQREYHLSQLIAYGLLEPEHIEYMDGIFGENSRCDFEFFVDCDGNLKDIFLHHYVTYEFEKLI